jgi:hypothetical protein
MGQKTMESALNLIRDSASQTYKDRVPVATRDNLAQVGAAILSYTAVTNEFLVTAINRIGLVWVRNKELRNPLAILKQGNVALGTDIEELAVNPAKAKTYNPTSTSLLTQTPPDVKTLYHRMNRQDMYPITISRQRMKGAFVSWESLESLFDAIMQAMYNGNYVDEFVLTKNLLGQAITDGACLTETVLLPTNEATGKAFAKTARQYFTNFQMPSSSYNRYAAMTGATGDPYITRSDADDIRFVLRSDVEAVMDVDVLAAAFNMDRAKLLGRMLVVDNFGSNTNVVGMMFDRSFPQIWDNLMEVTEFQNGENLSWNYYLHVWQTWSVSPLANAVAFVTA